VSRKNRSPSADEPLVCPSCARTYPLSERFCAKCGMPLVYAGFQTIQPTATRERALKIDPQLAHGEPVRVAYARQQAEAEMAEEFLLGKGIPSMIRRAAGVDNPDFLASGGRDIFVPASAAEVARDMLRDIGIQVVEPRQPGPETGIPITLRVALAVLCGGGFAALIAWLLVRSAG
jgi:hypothetical protein